jgi:hypothetical protein
MLLFPSSFTSLSPSPLLSSNASHPSFKPLKYPNCQSFHTCLQELWIKLKHHSAQLSFINAANSGFLPHLWMLKPNAAICPFTIVLVHDSMSRACVGAANLSAPSSIQIRVCALSLIVSITISLQVIIKMWHHGGIRHVYPPPAHCSGLTRVPQSKKRC